MEWECPAGLMREFPAWRIERHELGVAWIAVRQQGTFSQVLAAYDLDSLRGKLECADSRGPH